MLDLEKGMLFRTFYIFEGPEKPGQDRAFPVNSWRWHRLMCLLWRDGAARCHTEALLCSRCCFMHFLSSSTQTVIRALIRQREKLDLKGRFSVWMEGLFRAGTGRQIRGLCEHIHFQWRTLRRNTCLRAFLHPRPSSCCSSGFLGRHSLNANSVDHQDSASMPLPTAPAIITSNNKKEEEETDQCWVVFSPSGRF